ncbi:hypothetical protein [Cupriavidus malaysiensis]|uniref:Uncharacterized protein n=1 Tax=Cupriavidus malaysiensis TaxID=367825 RepID=A0ABN4TKD2_9BURK|nr:hypothetical protein [Cupriavidus malaysiensis]AOZ06744.1 hypothetical protein BKK80_13645 [Cupriavidus malaysiensis]
MTRNQTREAQAWLLNVMGDHDFTMPAVAFDTIVAALSQQSEPSAWVHEDDPTRVISAAQKAGAVRDGGASASSVRPYSLAAFVCQAQSASLLDAKAAFEVWARGQGLDPLPASEGSLRTYRYLETEHAWRGWANSKPSASPAALTDEPRWARAGLTEHEVQQIAWSYFHDGDTDLGDIKAAIKRALCVAVDRALLASKPSETRDADEYEMRADGKRVHKGRWEDGFRSIVSIVRGPRGGFEIDEIVELVRGLALDAERYRLARRGQHWSVVDGIGNALRAEELDAAIDAALAAQREGGAA